MHSIGFSTSVQNSFYREIDLVKVFHSSPNNFGQSINDSQDSLSLLSIIQNSAFLNAQLITRYWPMTGHSFLLARKDLVVLQNRQNGKQWSIGPVGLFKKAQINCGDLLKAFI